MTAVVQAWELALGAEQEAAFGYSILGPQLGDGVAATLARTCQAAHAALALATADAISAAGTQPVDPQVDYPALYPVNGAAAAMRLATRLEEQAAAAWRSAYAAAALSSGPTADQVRGAAQQALITAAVAATRWRRQSGSRVVTVPFPVI